MQRQFPSRGHHKGQGRIRIIKTRRAAQQHGRKRQAERHRLARPGLGGNQNIGFSQFRGQNRLLHWGQDIIAAFAQCLAKRRDDAFEFRHIFYFRNADFLRRLTGNQYRVCKAHAATPKCAANQ